MSYSESTSDGTVRQESFEALCGDLTAAPPSPARFRVRRRRYTAVRAGVPLLTDDADPTNSQNTQQADQELAQLAEAQLVFQHPAVEEHASMASANNAFPSLDSPISNNNRGGVMSNSSLSGPQTNGNNIASNANYMAPLPVGHQQDLNHLYTQIQELGAILKSNREKVNSVTKAAEEVAKRANTNGTHVDGEVQHESNEARIHDLERQLAKANYMIDLYKHEQTENTNLIALYEDAIGTMTEQIRNYCLGIEQRFLDQRRHYNNLLQQEKDDHLQSRLDRDAWFAKTLRCSEMIRTANRLRTDEWCEEYQIISSLQAQVRCFRRIIGLEPEAPEEETGWPYLKDMPLNDTT